MEAEGKGEGGKKGGRVCKCVFGSCVQESPGVID